MKHHVSNERGGYRGIPTATEPLGVYNAVTNKMVPHKEVRKWLKSQGMRAGQMTQSGKGR